MEIGFGEYIYIYICLFIDTYIYILIREDENQWHIQPIGFHRIVKEGALQTAQKSCLERGSVPGILSVLSQTELINVLGKKINMDT